MGCYPDLPFSVRSYVQKGLFFIILYILEESCCSFVLLSTNIPSCIWTNFAIGSISALEKKQNKNKINIFLYQTDIKEEHNNLMLIHKVLATYNNHKAKKGKQLSMGYN